MIFKMRWYHKSNNFDTYENQINLNLDLLEKMILLNEKKDMVTFRNDYRKQKGRPISHSKLST